MEYVFLTRKNNFWGLTNHEDLLLKTELINQSNNPNLIFVQLINNNNPNATSKGWLAFHLPRISLVSLLHVSTGKLTYKNNYINQNYSLVLQWAVYTMPGVSKV